MCTDCFNHSGHREHKYKMHASGGSGYCDCGDAEAWTSEPACSLHVAAPADSDEGGGIPPELRRRLSYPPACIP